MAELLKLRLSDDDDGPDVSDGHRALEAALSEIFSIEDGVDITQAIFGTPSSTEQATGRTVGVNSSGQIWMLRYKSESVAVDGRDGMGLDFTDGDKRKRLTFVNSQVAVWEETSADTWEEIFNLETTEDGKLSELADVGPRIQSYSSEDDVIAVYTEAGKIEGVISL